MERGGNLVRATHRTHSPLKEQEVHLMQRLPRMALLNQFRSISF
jgi:hypothetical protein